MEKKLKITFASPFKKSDEKENEKKNWNGNFKAFSVTRKRKKIIIFKFETFVCFSKFALPHIKLYYQARTGMLKVL